MKPVFLLTSLAALPLLAFSEPANVSLEQSPLSDQKIDVDINDTCWENFVKPGPVLVSLIGRLMVLGSSLKDFSLIEAVDSFDNDNDTNTTISITPTYNFTYIRNPTSFRATLVQIANDAWSAFNVVHKNVNKIQLYMSGMHSNINSASKAIDVAPTARMIKHIVTQELWQIQSKGNEYAKAVAEVEETFAKFTLVLEEILEATVSALNASDMDIEVEQESYVTVMETVGDTNATDVNSTNLSVTTVKEIQAQQIIGLLSETVSQAATVRSHWNKFGHRTESVLNQTVHNSLTVIEGKNGKKHVTTNEQAHLKFTLREQNAELDRIADFIKMVSSTYATVFHKLLGQLAGMVKVMAINTKMERESFVTKLVNKIEEIQQNLHCVSGEAKVQKQLNEDSELLKSLGQPIVAEKQAA